MTMKKYISMLLAVMMTVILMMSPVFAVSKSTALKKAKQYVPSGAILKDTDKEGTFYEFEFYNKEKTKTYTILINAKNKLVEKEVDVVGKAGKGGSKFTISASKASSAVKEAFKGITVKSTVKAKDDGCVYIVCFTKGSTVGIANVNSDNGKIVKWTKVYHKKSSKFISPKKARSKLLAKQSGMKMTDIDLDYNAKAKRWDYELEGRAGNYEYELELNAKTGKQISFEKDYEPVK